MKSVGGAGLVIIGFLFLYLAITGRLDCFFTFVSCVTGAQNPTSGASSSGSGGSGGLNLGSIVNTGIGIYNGTQGGSTSGAPSFSQTPSVISAPLPLFH